MRNTSKVAPEWWDYTTLGRELLDEAAALDEKSIKGLERKGFAIRFYDTIEDFFLAEALVRIIRTGIEVLPRVGYPSRSSWFFLST